VTGRAKSVQEKRLQVNVGDNFFCTIALRNFRVLQKAGAMREGGRDRRLALGSKTKGGRGGMIYKESLFPGNRKEKKKRGRGTREQDGNQKPRRIETQATKSLYGRKERGKGEQKPSKPVRREQGYEDYFLKTNQASLVN